MAAVWGVVLAMLVAVIASQDAPQKTWIFSVSGNRSPFNFIDDQGNVTGFDLDIVQEVCREAGKQCEVQVHPFTDCVLTNEGHFQPGQGLLSGQVEACVGYTVSADRLAVVDFTDPFYRTEARLTVKRGNPSGVSLHNLAQFTITHLTGAYTNAQCLQRLGHQVGNVIVAADLPEARQLVLNGSADAIFSPRSRITPFEALPEVLHCDEGGVAVMVRKGSSLPSWWNPAFLQLRQSGQYQQLCNAVPAKYNARPIKCLHPLTTAGNGEHSHIVG